MEVMLDGKRLASFFFEALWGSKGEGVSLDKDKGLFRGSEIARKHSPFCQKILMPGRESMIVHPTCVICATYQNVDIQIFQVFSNRRNSSVWVCPLPEKRGITFGQ